ncbi:MAG: hypothetical protein H7330_12255 [Hymenobacteraceae bacterium]|nr:hypothetical protein [Hymenobacteraceae bacterium]
MSRFWLLLITLTLGLAKNVAAQTPDSASPPIPTDPTLAAAPQPLGVERNINRQATPIGTELLLYAEPAETSRTLRISAHRQLFVRSLLDSTWYRALYGGTQFYVKRTDVTLLAPAAPTPAARSKKASVAGKVRR